MKKSSIKIICLGFFLISSGFLFSNCISRRPIILENVYVQPDVDFEVYRKIAIAEFTAIPEITDDKNFNALVEDEFSKNGFDVVGMEPLNYVLDQFGYSNEDLSNPNVLRKIGEQLKVTAVVRGEVRKYEIKKQKGHIPFIVGGGIMLVEETDVLCDISLLIEMLETKSGNNVWSCSVSCSKKKGKPEKVIRSMIRDSLNTIAE